jgi:hypothetical protein
MGSFAHVLAYKSPKTPFFAQKHLTRYTHETFLRNMSIFKITTLAIAELYLFKVSEVIYASAARIRVKYWRVGHYFFILKGHHLVFPIKGFAAT